MLRCDLSLHKSTLTVPSHLFFYVLKHIEVVGFFLSFIEPFSNALKKTASQENCPFSELVSLGGCGSQAGHQSTVIRAKSKSGFIFPYSVTCVLSV